MRRALQKWEQKRDPEGYKARFEKSTAGRRLRNRAGKLNKPLPKPKPVEECTETKPCATCGVVKPLNLFIVQSRNKDGRGAHCLECHRPVKRAEHSDQRVKNGLAATGNRRCCECKQEKPSGVEWREIHGTGRVFICSECDPLLGDSFDSQFVRL